MAGCCSAAIDSVVECGEDHCCCAYGTDCCLFVCLRPTHDKRVVYALYPRGPQTAGGVARGLRAVDVSDLVSYAAVRASRLSAVGDELHRRILRDLRRGRLGYVEVGMEAVVALMEEVGGGGGSGGVGLGVFEVVVQSLVHSLLQANTMPRAQRAGAHAAVYFAQRQNYLLDQHKLSPLGNELLEVGVGGSRGGSGGDLDVDIVGARIEALRALAEVVRRSDAGAVREHAKHTLPRLAELMRQCLEHAPRRGGSSGSSGSGSGHGRDVGAGVDGGSSEGGGIRGLSSHTTAVLAGTMYCLRSLALATDLTTSSAVHAAAIAKVKSWGAKSVRASLALLRCVDASNVIARSTRATEFIIPPTPPIPSSSSSTSSSSLSLGVASSGVSASKSVASRDVSIHDVVLVPSIHSRVHDSASASRAMSQRSVAASLTAELAASDTSPSSTMLVLLAALAREAPLLSEEAGDALVVPLLSALLEDGDGSTDQKGAARVEDEAVQSLLSPYWNVWGDQRGERGTSVATAVSPSLWSATRHRAAAEAALATAQALGSPSNVLQLATRLADVFAEALSTLDDSDEGDDEGESAEEGDGGSSESGEGERKGGKGGKGGGKSRTLKRRKRRDGKDGEAPLTPFATLLSSPTEFTPPSPPSVGRRRRQLSISRRADEGPAFAMATSTSLEEGATRIVCVLRTMILLALRQAAATSCDARRVMRASKVLRCPQHLPKPVVPSAAIERQRWLSAPPSYLPATVASLADTPDLSIATLQAAWGRVDEGRKLEASSFESGVWYGAMRSQWTARGHCIMPSPLAVALVTLCGARTSELSTLALSTLSLAAEPAPIDACDAYLESVSTATTSHFESHVTSFPLPPTALAGSTTQAYASAVMAEAKGVLTTLEAAQGEEAEEAATKVWKDAAGDVTGDVPIPAATTIASSITPCPVLPPIELSNKLQGKEATFVAAPFLSRSRPAIGPAPNVPLSGPTRAAALVAVAAAGWSAIRDVAIAGATEPIAGPRNTLAAAVAAAIALARSGGAGGSLKVASIALDWAAAGDAFSQATPSRFGEMTRAVAQLASLAVLRALATFLRSRKLADLVTKTLTALRRIPGLSVNVAGEIVFQTSSESEESDEEEEGEDVAVEIRAEEVADAIVHGSESMLSAAKSCAERQGLRAMLCESLLAHSKLPQIINVLGSSALPPLPETITSKLDTPLTRSQLVLLAAALAKDRAKRPFGARSRVEPAAILARMRDVIIQPLLPPISWPWTIEASKTTTASYSSRSSTTQRRHLNQKDAIALFLVEKQPSKSSSSSSSASFSSEDHSGEGEGKGEAEGAGGRLQRERSESHDSIASYKDEETLQTDLLDLLEALLPQQGTATTATSSPASSTSRIPVVKEGEGDEEVDNDGSGDAELKSDEVDLVVDEGEVVRIALLDLRTELRRVARQRVRDRGLLFSVDRVFGVGASEDGFDIGSGEGGEAGDRPSSGGGAAGDVSPPRTSSFYTPPAATISTMAKEPSVAETVAYLAHVQRSFASDLDIDTSILDAEISAAGAEWSSVSSEQAQQDTIVLGAKATSPSASTFAPLYGKMSTSSPLETREEEAILGPWRHVDFLRIAADLSTTTALIASDDAAGASKEC